MLRREALRTPPVLHAYPGSPRTLMLHQLLLSPIFGLTTVYSKQVETLRAEFKTLHAKKSRTAADNARLMALRTALEDLPDWTAETPRERKQHAALKEIQKAIKDNPALLRSTEGRAGR